MTACNFEDLAALKKEFFRISRNLKCPPDFFPSLNKNLVYVPMNDLTVVSATENCYCVGTSDLTSCAGIAIYDPDTKVGGVAHISFNPEIEGYITPVRGFQFSRFSDYADRLISTAGKNGGNKYLFYAFNIGNGCRTQSQNSLLTEIVKTTVDQWQEKEKIIGFEYRDERAFLLNTKTGDILPNL